MLRISVVGWSMSCRGGSCRPKRCLMTLDVVERTGHSLNGWSAVSVLTENVFCFLSCGRKMILPVLLFPAIVFENRWPVATIDKPVFSCRIVVLAFLIRTGIHSQSVTQSFFLSHTKVPATTQVSGLDYTGN